MLNFGSDFNQLNNTGFLFSISIYLYLILKNLDFLIALVTLLMALSIMCVFIQNNTFRVFNIFNLILFLLLKYFHPKSKTINHGKVRSW